MTHDELLDAINIQIMIAPPFELGGYTRFLQAFAAVVKLHKPSLREYTQEIGCVGCGINSEYADWQESWPCPTIQAIKAELR